MEARILIFFAAVLFGGQLRAQPVLVSATDPPVKLRTWAGSAPVQTTAASVSPQLVLLAVANPETMLDTGQLKARLSSLYAEAGREITVRAAVWTAEGMQFAGPFRSRSQFQSALRELTELGIAHPLLLSDDQFWSQLPAAVGQAGGGWMSVVVVGQLPRIEPVVAEYATAYVVHKIRNQRIRLSFSTPGEDPGDPVRSISKALAYAAELETYVEVNVNMPALSRGFELRKAALEDTQGKVLMERQAIASAPDFALPDIERYRALLASMAEAKKQLVAGALDAAVTEVQKALAINPHDPVALRLGASLFEKRSDPKSASEMLLLLVETDPRNGALLAEAGGQLFSATDFERAKPLLIRARDAGTFTAESAHQLARIHEAAKDYTAAIQFFDESLKMDPNAAVWYERSDAANAMGNWEVAAESLEKGLALGPDLDRRSSLIRVYLDHKRGTDALRQVHAALTGLPLDVKTRTLYAGFLDELDRKEEALELWRKTLELEPQHQLANVRVARLLLDLKQYPGALEASEKGLAITPDARLYLCRAEALDRLQRIYDERRALSSAAAAVPTDVDLLKLRAAVEDAMGWDGAAAYGALAKALEKNGAAREQALARGLVVAVRDREWDAAAQFSSELSSLGKKEYAAWAGQAHADQSGETVVPGGVAALVFIARGKMPAKKHEVFIEHCRAVLSRTGGAPKEYQTYVETIRQHFVRIAALQALGTKNGDDITIHLSIQDKKARQRTEKVLALLGWRMKASKNAITVEALEKGSAAKRQETASALAIDEVGMQEALEAGKPFDIEIPYERVPVFPEERTWRETFYNAEPTPGGLAEALARDPRLAHVYLGLNTVSRETASALLSRIGLKPLVEKYSGLMSQYASALAVTNGRVAAPGGAGADPVWIKLAGTSPAQPAPFLRALFDRDKGRLLGFYATLAQLDSAHQRFFTRTTARASQFLELFEQSETTAAGRLHQFNPFVSFLEDVPLNDDGTVDFPGSAEVWMVAKGQSANAGRTEKLMKKVRKAVAPELEDEILLRLAKTRYKSAGLQRNELDDFLAVVHIDQHRADPLDEASALTLAQHHVEYETFYPYFSIYTALSAKEFDRFFAMGERLHMATEIERDLALGQIHGLLAIAAIARQSGAIDDKRATEFFYRVCDQFAIATTDADRASTALNLIRLLLDAAGFDREKDPDGAVASMLIGDRLPIHFEVSGRGLDCDSVIKHRENYDRVLRMQKIPRLATLFRLQTAALSVAAQSGPADPYLKVIDSERANIPEADLSKKQLKETGKDKWVLQAYSGAGIGPIAGQFRQKLSKKKVNRKDLDKIAHDFMAALNGPVTLALTGIVYAYYLHPDDLIVAEDPLLVRKHQFIEFGANTFKPGTPYPDSDLRVKSEGLGSYVVGGLADFAMSAGAAARVGMNATGVSEFQSAAQMAALRSTQWRHLREEDAVLLGLRLRVAREWIVEAAFDPKAHDTLADDTLGLLSLTRRNDLLNAISTRDWRAAAESATLGDLFNLSARYLARYSEADPWKSPATAALRDLARRNHGERLEWLGPVMPNLLSCVHPHLVPLPPYEDYEGYMHPTRLSERASELKLYLAALADREGIPPAALGVLAEPAAVQTLRRVKMADVRDWRSVVAAYSSIDSRVFEEAAAAK
jgi:tetratricopeptide (TPR) repeat protein